MAQAERAASRRRLSAGGCSAWCHGCLASTSSVVAAEVSSPMASAGIDQVAADIGHT
jgi:hypothetical protein